MQKRQLYEDCNFKSDEKLTHNRHFTMLLRDWTDVENLEEANKFDMIVLQRTIIRIGANCMCFKCSFARRKGCQERGSISKSFSDVTLYEYCFCKTSHSDAVVSYNDMTALRVMMIRVNPAPAVSRRHFNIFRFQHVCMTMQLRLLESANAANTYQFLQVA